MNRCDYCVYRIENEYSKPQFNMCWVKIQDIADTLRTSKWEIYRTLLREYGRSQFFQVDENGLSVLLEEYPIVDLIGDGVVRAYKGIEYMNSKELSAFTDGVLEEWREVCNVGS